MRSESTSAEGAVTWRVQPAWMALVVTGWAVVMLAIFLGLRDADPTFAYPLFAVPSGLSVWLYTLRPYLRADDHGVCIRNPWRRHVVPWSDIAAIRPGYYGIWFDLSVNGG